MIIRARIVVTMDGPPIENGAVLVSGNRIAAVGKFSEIKRLPSLAAGLSASPSGRGSRVAAGEGKFEIIDLGDQVLLPGLINAHCHLDYTCLRGKIPRQRSFTDWIRLINAEKTKLSPNDYIASINDGFREAKRFGTATIANLTGFPELISEIKPPIRTWWFAELMDIRQEISDQNLNALCIQVSAAAGRWGLAPHAPFTASRNLYRRCEEIAEREDVLLTTHLAESREERMMFRHARGPLYEFLRGIGRDIGDCGDATPTEYFFGQKDSANRRYLLAHLNEVSDNDFDLLKGVARRSSIVHCPRSHKYFGHSPFQFQKLQEIGFNICLGTDSLASNDDLSLFAEMRAFQKQFPNVSPEEIAEMVTVNPARALGQLDSLGKIRKDFAADLIAIPITTSASIYEELIAFDRTVNWSMIGGRILA